MRPTDWKALGSPIFGVHVSLGGYFSFSSNSFPHEVIGVSNKLKSPVFLYCFAPNLRISLEPSSPCILFTVG